MKRLFVVFSLLFSHNISAAELSGVAYWEGLKSSLTYFYQGAGFQFTAQNNLYYAGAAVPIMWFSFEEDKRVTNHEMTKKIPKYMQLTSDLAPALSFPVIPLAFFSYGIKKDDSKAVEFAKETFATMYLALLESAALSLVDVHERPKKDKLSKWETNFRGDSSFPSGHVIPYAALAIKTWQFYGPYYAIFPATLFAVTSVQRVRDGKHYLSDITGAFFLTAFAAEGVREAGKSSADIASAPNEESYSLGYVSHRGVVGPQIIFVW